MGSEIRQCGGDDQTGKVLYDSLDFPFAGGEKQAGGTYRLPLTDAILQDNLPYELLAQVCQDAGKAGYYLSPPSLQVLKTRLNPGNKGINLSPDADGHLVDTLTWLVDHPPPLLETEIPNTNSHIVTSMLLDPVEVALFRQAVDDSLETSSSFFRRIPNPVYGSDNEAGPARYAISIKMDATQYDQVLFYLSQFVAGSDATPETIVRVTRLQNEIQELKMASLKKSAPNKALVIPDAYFGSPQAVGPAREKMAQLQENFPSLLSAEVDLDDYTLFREPLFSSDVAFIRFKLNDDGNSLFVNYNGHVSSDPSQPQAYYIKRDIDWDHLTASLSVLERTCRTERLDDALCNRMEKLVFETERLDRKVKEESFMYKIEEGLPIAIDFVGLGTGLGVAGGAMTKGPALIKWMASKITGGKGPQDGGPEGGSPLISGHPFSAAGSPPNLAEMDSGASDNFSSSGTTLWEEMKEHPYITAGGVVVGGLAVAGLGYSVSLLLAADDVTGVGTLDDVALPFTLGTGTLGLAGAGAGALFLVGISDTPPTQWMESRNAVY